MYVRPHHWKMDDNDDDDDDDDDDELLHSSWKYIFLR